MAVSEQDPLERALAAWRADIDSVHIPELFSVHAAVALVIAARERGARQYD